MTRTRWSTSTLPDPTYFHFVPNQQPNIGHLDSLGVEDSLFLADLNRDGDISTATPNGVIYEILALP